MNFRNPPKVAVIAIAIAGILLTVTTAAVLSASQNVPLNGTITAINLGIYSDSACTQTVTAFNVGNISPGGTGTQTVYIKNIGTISETLTMTTTNWTPANANTYLTLTWNKQNTVLPVGQSTPATLTLTAASNTGTLTTFSCSVTITGTQ